MILFMIKMDLNLLLLLQKVSESGHRSSRILKLFHNKPSAYQFTFMFSKYKPKSAYRDAPALSMISSNAYLFVCDHFLQ